MLRVALAVLAVSAQPSHALERRSAPSVMAARRSSAQPSAMAVRRSGASPQVRAEAPAPAVPAADPAPEGGPFGPRITPPTGTPTPAHDTRRAQGWAYSAPAAPAPGAPLPAVGASAPSESEKGPAGVTGSAVTVLRPGQRDRQFGGAQDPVLFLVGGTGPNGSVSQSSDGSALSISLGAGGTGAGGATR